MNKYNKLDLIQIEFYLDFLFLFDSTCFCTGSVAWKVGIGTLFKIQGHSSDLKEVAHKQISDFDPQLRTAIP